MPEQENRQIRLKRRPVGLPAPGDFEHATAPLPVAGPGEVLLKHLYLSIDPAIRGWMREARSYLPPIAIGAPIRSGTLSQVVESKADGFAPGDLVRALAAWETYSAVSTERVYGKVVPVKGVPLQSMLSVLGGTGLTAYFGLLEVGRPVAGETVVVSAAAGGVGSVAGQLARIAGCHTVGLTGNDTKCKWLTEELGYDAAINYKGADLSVALAKACPRGVDVFFDNVGGDILDMVLLRLNRRGRVALCGAISQINQTGPPSGPSNYLQLLAKSARMEGFTTMDFADRYDEARGELAQWIQEGELRYRDDVVEGLEQAPIHLLRLFSGDHRGKLMVKLADPEV